MHTEPQARAAETVGLAAVRGRKAFAAVTLVMAAVFLVYWQTSASMVQTWARSETFKHCFLVLPAVLWFVWQARARLAATAIRPWWPALIPLAAAGALWLIGELANSLAPTQWAMVLMVPSAIVALFGVGWGRILGFPLAFLFFAVPFGEAITPTLIDWTADFTVGALSATGVPVFREGQHFVIPSGRWSVVEACSGVRYLMASVVVGVLYAWTIYRSPVRRALFIGASIVVPIVANWLRAYLIVMIGHLSSNRLAVGVDHFIYGWVFFGIVIGLMLWIGDPLARGPRRRADAHGSAEPKHTGDFQPRRKTAAVGADARSGWTADSGLADRERVLAGVDGQAAIAAGIGFRVRRLGRSVAPGRELDAGTGGTGPDPGADILSGRRHRYSLHRLLSGPAARARTGEFDESAAARFGTGHPDRTRAHRRPIRIGRGFDSHGHHPRWRAATADMALVLAG